MEVRSDGNAQYSPRRQGATPLSEGGRGLRPQGRGRGDTNRPSLSEGGAACGREGAE